MPCQGNRSRWIKLRTTLPKHYNRKEQAVVADYVVIMGYDEHFAGSDEAGSVASKEFVAQGIADTLTEVPPEKMINAIPFYTRLGDRGGRLQGTKALSVAEGWQYVQDNGAEAPAERYWPVLREVMRLKEKLSDGLRTRVQI